MIVDARNLHAMQAEIEGIADERARIEEGAVERARQFVEEEIYGHDCAAMDDSAIEQMAIAFVAAVLKRGKT